MSNADTLRRVFSLMDEHNDSAIRELLAPGFRAIMGGNPPMSAEEWAGMGEMMYAAFPDGQHTVDETLQIGDRVVVRGRFSGTHTGEFMGIAPTGKEITITFMNIDRFAGEKLIEHRAEADMAGLMQQLAATPTPAPA
jgi:predicted ester cyclase